MFLGTVLKSLLSCFLACCLFYCLLCLLAGSRGVETGSFFGEMALMTAQPRSASVVCGAMEGCVVDEISGDDFASLLMARRTGFRRDLMRMLRARQFRHGVYKLLLEIGGDAHFTDKVRGVRRTSPRAVGRR